VSDATIELFETLASVLLYCWVFGFGLLLFWFGMYRAGGRPIHRHSGLFRLTPHELDVIFYCGIGLRKLGVLLLFFFLGWRFKWCCDVRDAGTRHVRTVHFRRRK
jgi:hypothetical protein